MNSLRENVADYLATRRALGFKVEGLSKLLRSFVAFCEESGFDTATVEWKRRIRETERWSD